MDKYKALVTAEVVKPILEEKLSHAVEFDYAGYNLNHVVLSRTELLEKIRDVDILICEYDTITAEVLDAAKNLKIIICCRGGVKTVVDLEAAMERGIIVCHNIGRNAGAALDVTRKEPISSASELIGTPNLLITPHIAGSANDVQLCGTKMITNSLLDWINGKKPRNIIVYK